MLNTSRKLSGIAAALLIATVAHAKTDAIANPHPHTHSTATAKANAAALTATPHRILCPPAGFEKELVIHQLSVGQGDSALIRTPSGLMILIDGGEVENAKNVILPTIQQCYQGTGKFKLDYIVLTHPHSDHFGGLLELLKVKTFPVGAIIFPSDKLEASESGSQFNELLTLADTLKSKGTRKILPSGLGSKEIKDADVDFDIVVSDGHVEGKGEVASVHDANGMNVDNNSVSIGMMITYKNFKFFTAGDLTGGKTAKGENHPDVESTVAKAVSRVDVFKASHHGSDTSNKAAILDVLQPTNVLVSVGSGGKNLQTFHLPRKEAISAMNALPSVKNIFLTSQGQSEDILPVGKFPGMGKVHDLGGMIGSDLIVTTNPAGTSYVITGYKFQSPVFQTVTK